MKVETEIKLILGGIDIEDLTSNIEKNFDVKGTEIFHLGCNKQRLRKGDSRCVYKLL